MGLSRRWLTEEFKLGVVWRLKSYKTACMWLHKLGNNYVDKSHDR